MIQTGYNLLKRGEGEYTVLTPEHKEYAVDLTAETCTCPRYQFGQRPCKHIEYVRQETQPKPERRPRRRRPALEVSVTVGGRPVTETREEFAARIERDILIDF